MQILFNTSKSLDLIKGREQNIREKPAELPCMLPEESFQLEHNFTKLSVVLEDALILQEAKNGLSSLHEGEYNSIISKSPINVGRTNLFQMDIPTVGLPVAYELYPILLKHHKLENAGCVSKSLHLWAVSVIIVPKSQIQQTLVRNSFT